MENERLKRQMKLAKLFVEMGMDYELVAKISGVDMEVLSKDVDKEEKTIYNSLHEQKNNSYSEPRDRGNQ